MQFEQQKQLLFSMKIYFILYILFNSVYELYADEHNTKTEAVEKGFVVFSVNWILVSAPRNLVHIKLSILAIWSVLDIYTMHDMLRKRTKIAPNLINNWVWKVFFAEIGVEFLIIWIFYSELLTKIFGSRYT